MVRPESRVLLDQTRKRNGPSILKMVSTRRLVFSGKEGAYTHVFRIYFNFSVSLKYQFSLVTYLSYIIFMIKFRMGFQIEVPEEEYFLLRTV